MLTKTARYALFLGALLIGISGAESARAQTPTSFHPPGDVTGDLEVNVDDAIQVLRYIAGLRILQGNEITAADVAPANPTGRMWGDSQVDVSDAVRILRRTVGLEPDPWPGGPPITPSTNLTRITLSATDSPYKAVVNDGVFVTGKLIDEKAKPISADVYYWNSTRRLLGKVTSDALGAFTFSAPQGQYDFSTITTVSDTPSGASVEIPNASIIKIQITPGMAPIEVGRGAVPTLFTVKVTLNSVPANFTPVRVEFLDQERQFEFAPPPTLGRSGPLKGGLYTAILPQGTYKALVILNKKNTAGTVIGQVAALPVQTVSVFQNRSLSLTVPPIGSLSGSFTTLTLNGASGPVLAGAVQDTQNGGGASGSIAAGKYQLPLQTGVTYRLQFIPDFLNPVTRDLLREVSFIPSDLSVNGNTTVNFTLPTPYPASQNFQFWVGDELGRAVSNARVRLASVVLGGLNAGYEVAVDTDADDSGVVSVNVPLGTYDLTVGPARTLSTVEDLGTAQ